MSRAKRIVVDLGDDVVEHGYLLLAEGYRRITAGDAAGACALFTEAASVGERFDDLDLVNLSRQGRGRALIRLDRIDEGMALLDEVMIAVTAGEVSTVIVGNIYCSVIEGCHEVFDIRRAHEWTAALAAWCSAQPEIVPYRGQCLVRRAEILQLHGEWPGALDEAEKACVWLSSPHAHPAIGAAHYQRAELHRLRGAFTKAEEAYARASEAGRSPQPGLALLRFAQGQGDAAWAAIRRAIDDAHDRRARARMLAAGVEIALGRRAVAAARAAADELTTLAATLDSTFLRGVAAQAAGAVLIDEGNPHAALAALKTAAAAWNEIGAPYEAARVRVLAGRACRALGDDDAWTMELEAARSVFTRLGSVPDLERVEALAGRPADGPGNLTGREVQVLRLVATGRTNRAIADELDISEKTVARHLSNIFTKLDLPSRAAATAYAYQHGFVRRSPT